MRLSLKIFSNTRDSYGANEYLFDICYKHEAPTEPLNASVELMMTIRVPTSPSMQHEGDLLEKDKGSVRSLVFIESQVLRFHKLRRSFVFLYFNFIL